MSATKLDSRLPEGIYSWAELAYRYLVMDGEITAADIRRRIKADHGVDASKKAIVSARERWLRKTGKKSPNVKKHSFGKGRSKALHRMLKYKSEIGNKTVNAVQILGNAWNGDPLSDFVNAVKSVGGVMKAKKILELVETMKG